MGAVYLDFPAHHSLVHKLHPPDPKDTGGSRDRTIHLCGNVRRPDPALDSCRVGPGDRELRLSDVLQPSPTANHPVVWL